MATLVFEFKPPEAKDPKALQAGAFNVFQAHGNTFDARLKIERMRGRPGVNRRSGHLAQGWNVQTTATATGIETINWLSGPAAEQNGRHGYGWVQEHGADIVPVKAKWLCIPTKENQTPAGVARITPREAIDQGGFFRKGILFGKVGKRGVVPLFILKKRVRIPARLGATDLWNSMLPALEDQIWDVVERCV